MRLDNHFLFLGKQITKLVTLETREFQICVLYDKNSNLREAVWLKDTLMACDDFKNKQNSV